MKRVLLGVAAAAMTFTGFAASAQSYGGRYDQRSGYDQRGSYDQHRSYDRDRGDQHRDWNRNDNRGGHWREGQHYADYGRRDRMISNWRAYNLPAPRAGYGYYREDNGDVVMAALASGLIGLVIGNALSNNNDGYSNGYGYAQPAYQQPYYGYGNQQPYGYQPYGYQSYGYRR